MKTWIFTGVVLALVAFSVFDYKRSQKTADLGEGEERILTLQEGSINSLLIQSPKQTMEFKNIEGSWKLVQPLQDDVDDVQFVGLLNALREAKVIPANDPGTDTKKFGFDAGTQIQIKTDQGTEESFRISEASAFDGSFYVERKGKVYVGDRGLARIIEKEVKDMRSPYVWRTRGEVYKVVIKDRLGLPMTFVKNEDKWKSEVLFDLPVDSGRVRDWLQSVRDLRTVEILTPDMVPRQQVPELLKNPVMVFEFWVKKDGVESKPVWTIAQPKGEFHIIQNSLSQDLYKVSKASLREILIPVEQLLDSSGVLDFPLEQATEMTLKLDGQTMSFRKIANEWEKSEALVDFFGKLKALDPLIGEIPEQLKFDPLKNGLVIHGSSGVLLDLAWTAEKDQLRWLKIAKFKEKFKVSAERFRALLKGFTSKSEAKPPAAQ